MARRKASFNNMSDEGRLAYLNTVKQLFSKDAVNETKKNDHQEIPRLVEGAIRS